MRFSRLARRLYLYLTRRENLVSILIGVCIAVAVYAVHPRSGKAKQPEFSEQKPHITSLPVISSCIGEITVENAFLRNPESVGGVLVLQVRNNTSVAVVAISIEARSKTDHSAYEIVTNSFEDDKPTTILEPHSSGEFTIEVSNIRPDGVVKVGSVVFADGREVGCKASLKSMRESKSMHLAQRAAKKLAKAAQ